ncbi:MAG: hypothetical protein KatS3mg002_0896 [Candidatus Woesearchaeota archaeon]|nr:MAG: hypothetical protein KatS3mg002_0896 [Candidatus Woesearchaeota archaeon]
MNEIYIPLIMLIAFLVAYILCKITFEEFLEITIYVKYFFLFFGALTLSVAFYQLLKIYLRPTKLIFPLELLLSVVFFLFYNCFFLFL